MAPPCCYAMARPLDVGSRTPGALVLKGEESLEEAEPDSGSSRLTQLRRTVCTLPPLGGGQPKRPDPPPQDTDAREPASATQARTALCGGK